MKKMLLTFALAASSVCATEWAKFKATPVGCNFDHVCNPATNEGYLVQITDVQPGVTLAILTVEYTDSETGVFRVGRFPVELCDLTLGRDAAGNKVRGTLFRLPIKGEIITLRAEPLQPFTALPVVRVK